MTDGPFAETKEQLAGFYMIDAKDLDEALKFAARIPPARVGSIEVRPVRDLFAATFFFFFGMEVDPSSLPSVLPLAALLGVVTAGTKVLTGYWAAQRAGCDRRSAVRSGFTLIARGEFSIVIAGLGIGIEPQLGPLAAAYVLLLAVSGPVLVRVVR